MTKFTKRRLNFFIIHTYDSDDTQAELHFKPTDYVDAIINVNYAKRHSLTINEKKIIMLLFGNNNTRCDLTNNCSVLLNNVSIQYKDSCRNWFNI